jgi:hypothetical protein
MNSAYIKKIQNQEIINYLLLILIIISTGIAIYMTITFAVLIVKDQIENEKIRSTIYCQNTKFKDDFCKNYK